MGRGRNLKKIHQFLQCHILLHRNFAPQIPFKVPIFSRRCFYWLRKGKQRQCQVYKSISICFYFAFPLNKLVQFETYKTRHKCSSCGDSGNDFPCNKFRSSKGREENLNGVHSIKCQEENFFSFSKKKKKKNSLMQYWG